MIRFRFIIPMWLCVTALLPKVQADEWDKKTIFTFNAPVEVPGQVLTPGRYVFKLLNSSSDRNIVQVFNKDQTRLIGTFLTIPDYRMKPAEKPLLTFEERAAGSPEAIKAWFYPGDNYGNEFVYPKQRAVQLASQSQQNVPSMPTQLASNTTTTNQDQNSPKVDEMKNAKISAEEPSGDEVEVAQVFLVVAPADPPPPPPVPERVLVALVSNDPTPAKELPATASELPLLGLMGALTLAAGLVLRELSRSTP